MTTIQKPQTRIDLEVSMVPIVISENASMNKASSEDGLTPTPKFQPVPDIEDIYKQRSSDEEKRKNSELSNENGFIEYHSSNVTKDGFILEAFQFNYDHSRQCFLSNARVLIDIPKIPKCYTKGWYHDLLLVRYQAGEADQIASEVRKYLHFERLSSEVDLVIIVTLLLTSYPVLQFKHAELFDIFRRAVIAYREQYPVKFMQIWSNIVNFVRPGIKEVVPYKVIEPNFEGLASEDPIYRLNILYTLRVWNARPPFNTLVYSPMEMKRTERILMGYDIKNYYKRHGQPSKFLWKHFAMKETDTSLKDLISNLISRLLKAFH